MVWSACARLVRNVCRCSTTSLCTACCGVGAGDAAHMADLEFAREVVLGLQVQRALGLDLLQPQPQLPHHIVLHGESGNAR